MRFHPGSMVRNFKYTPDLLEYITGQPRLRGVGVHRPPAVRESVRSRRFPWIIWSPTEFSIEPRVFSQKHDCPTYAAILVISILVALYKMHIRMCFEKTFGRGAPPTEFKAVKVSQNPNFRNFPQNAKFSLDFFLRQNFRKIIFFHIFSVFGL